MELLSLLATGYINTIYIRKLIKDIFQILRQEADTIIHHLLKSTNDTKQRIQ